MKKSILAIVAGIVFTVVVTTLVDILMHAIAVFPPMPEPLTDSTALIATSYRIVISIAAAWLTSWLAPDKPMKHAMILGIVGTILGVIGVVATWNAGMGPRWYAIALAVLAIPQCWVGGKIFAISRDRN